MKNKKSYKFILFDLDGTLTDPKVGITKSIQYALRKFGIEESNLENLEKFIGPPLISALMEYYSFDEAKARKGVEYYREYFAETGIFENELFSKIPELLAGLKAADKELILATSKPTVYAERILQHFGIRKYFSEVIGSNLDGTRVEKKDIIEYILLDTEGIDQGNVIMVGDRKHDLIGAGENNIDSIGVTYGYGSVEELEKEKPSFLANSVEELGELLLS